MANTCYNWISVFGANQQMKTTEQLFEAFQIADQAKDSQLIPAPFKDQKLWMFNISICAKEFFTLITFGTQWNPNYHDMLEIADHLDVMIMHDFEVEATSRYGKYLYNPGKPAQVAILSNNDMDHIRYDEDADEYCLDELRSDCYADLANILLFDKIRENELESP